MPGPEPAPSPVPAPQVCQRCRRSFPGDPTLLPSALVEWWACPECRTALFGEEPTTPASVTA